MANDITSETIKTILEISRPEIHDITDALGQAAPFSSKPLHQIKAAPPAQPDTVAVHTLAGFADLIKGNLDTVGFKDQCLIHIVDEDTVHLIARNADEHGRRRVLIEAHPMDFNQFPFDRFLPQEDFNIKVAALFATTDDKAYVLQSAGSLTSESAATLTDDGFTQRAVAKAGLRTLENVVIRPLVVLSPYRTFPEAPQPVSTFILRARTDGTPSLALFEADGGKWKVQAIEILKTHLETFDLGIPIIA